jgi:hypothetical protein
MLKLRVRIALVMRCTCHHFMFVSELRQIGRFLRVLRFPSNKTDRPNYHTSENKEMHNKKHNTMNHICMIDCIISFSEKPQHLSVQSAACHTDAIT